MKNKLTLILGASGLIGGHIFNFFKNEGKLVIGTYCKHMQAGLIEFDLGIHSIENLPLGDVNYGIFCSAITRLDECKNDPEKSNFINVSKTNEIIRELSDRNISPIFLSSGAVFDGRKGGYTELDERNPVSVYGEQKLEVENFITRHLDNYLIVRPGKVCDFTKLFSDWMGKYNRGEVIICANDEGLSFTHPKDVAKAIALLLERNKKGTYHINPQEHYSRWDLANKFFERKGIKNANIKGCSIDEFGNAKRAKNSFMDASKFIGETGFEFTSLDKIIEDYK